MAVELLEVPEELIQTALDLELAERTVIADTVGETACIFLAGLYRAEQVIAERILRLANGKLPWPYIDPEKALPWIEQKTGLSLAESQVAAIRLALLSKVLVITGGPGVGKTTIVNSILRILAAKGVEPVAVCPDGPCRQAHDRSHRVRGQDHPPAARGGPERRRLQTEQPTTRSNAICWSSTRPPWSTSC